MTLDQVIALFQQAGGPDWSSKALTGLAAVAGFGALVVGLLAGMRR